MPNPPASPGVTRGRLNAAPCPHCGKFNDLTELAAMTADGFSKHGHGSLPGAKADCDHCGRCYIIAKVESVLIVTLRQAAGQRARDPGQPAPQQARPPQRPGFIERLLGKGRG
jgi:hypothetical protein